MLLRVLGARGGFRGSTQNAEHGFRGEWPPPAGDTCGSVCGVGRAPPRALWRPRRCAPSPPAVGPGEPCSGECVAWLGCGVSSRFLSSGPEEMVVVLRSPGGPRAFAWPLPCARVRSVKSVPSSAHLRLGSDVCLPVECPRLILGSLGAEGTPTPAGARRAWISYCAGPGAAQPSRPAWAVRARPRAPRAAPLQPAPPAPPGGRTPSCLLLGARAPPPPQLPPRASLFQAQF